MAQIIETIYVALLDEGVQVWRPARAERIRDGIYRILDGPRTGSEEAWEFGQGATVCCDVVLRDGKRFLVAKRLASESDTSL